MEHSTGAVVFCAIMRMYRCVMALTAEIGDRMKANMAHCNFMVGCEECWFDDAQVRAER